ncbi:Dinitrogenase iron-molybdenum cofactor biosynthesis protein [Solidesulfovibrio carbinoliphilus subsp. oakridgensis]|uniref:Dinitrogenase iron-molybdenum cofactor biosynthesis protein n=1 Tax=Solidesulfovibrio carbinoliphilus subsp. oakridgensis TaxID=694327 RepID=G7QBN4_9BACT|nr:NifB/NifX family molybdenum-iron cluster-binding protein [Solidesulfovibrio carbinoliphilus]EHJ48897.1 Dinitrogenase iron-molybdenum cofactor biosynthesis protein [Solidesulfovibrio carbinoliphilus subsp. oakridgensis]
MNTIIAVSSEGPGLDDAVDPRFGRAAGFVVVDGAGGTRYLDNGGSQAMAHGAGIESARRIAEAGAKVLLSGVVGPKAASALAAAGVAVVEGMEGLTVGEAVARYRAGQGA